MEILTGLSFLLVVSDFSFGLELEKISEATGRHARGLLDPLYKVKCSQACVGNLLDTPQLSSPSPKSQSPKVPKSRPKGLG